MTRLYIKALTVCLVVFAFATTTYAQDNTTDNVIRPITTSGSMAMGFTLGGFGTFGIGVPAIGSVSNVGVPTAIQNALGNPSGTIAGISGKYFISDAMALRVLLAFGTQSVGADSLAPGAVSATQFGIAAGLEWHMRPLYSTSPYAGVQVGFVSASVSDETKTGTGGSDQTVKYSGTAIGASVFAGFDWFFTRGIAIGAEYALGFTSGSTSFTPASGSSISNPSSTAIGLGLSGGASAHCIVYF